MQIKCGSVITYTDPGGRSVETKATTDPYQLYGKWVINILGRPLPVLLSNVKESTRAVGARNALHSSVFRTY